jgi:uncharacterized membrane protein YfcA
VTNAVLFLAAFVGGALNAVAGGGSFIALPALLFAGAPAVAANATTTLALWPGSLASAVAYRRELSVTRPWLVRLGGVSLVGGFLGGMLLVRTSDISFLRLLPWLMFLAAATFTFGAPFVARLRRGDSPDLIESGLQAEAPFPLGPPHSVPRTPHSAPVVPWWVLPLQLVIATYGGYFGGGIGIMMLALLAIAGMADIHEMNGVKSALAVVINGVALAEFVLSGTVLWGPGVVMMVGGIAGGYVGASMARRLSGGSVRIFVIAVAWAMTAYFFRSTSM